MSKNTDLAQAILDRVGGKENVVNAYHCMTRLRLTLKDNGKVEQESLKKLPGVMGLYDNNGEIQVILGPAVDNVYEEFVKISGVHREEAIPENEDPELTAKPKITPKSILKSILNAFSASISKTLPTGRNPCGIWLPKSRKSCSLSHTTPSWIQPRSRRV